MGCDNCVSNRTAACEALACVPSYFAERAPEAERYVSGHDLVSDKTAKHVLFALSASAPDSKALCVFKQRESIHNTALSPNEPPRWVEMSAEEWCSALRELIGQAAATRCSWKSRAVAERRTREMYEAREGSRTSCVARAPFPPLGERLLQDALNGVLL